MNIFKRKKKKPDPYKRRAEAQKRLDKLCSERDDLDKHHRWDYDYEEKRKALTRGIAAALSDKNLAEDEIRTPTSVPHTVIDNSNRVFAPKLGVKIGSDNTAEGKFIAYNKEDNSQKSRKQQHSSEPAEPTKKSNAKIIFFLVVFGLFLVGVAALSVYLSTCIGNKSAYSNAAASIFASTSE